MKMQPIPGIYFAFFNNYMSLYVSHHDPHTVSDLEMYIYFTVIDIHKCNRFIKTLKFYYNQFHNMKFVEV